MKQEIIQQMRAKVDSYQGAYSDFKQDLKILEFYEEAFFWVVRDMGTSICRVGKSIIDEFELESASRFQIFNNFNAPIEGILYYSGKYGETYYYDPCVGALCQITRDEVIAKWHEIFQQKYYQMVSDYWEDYDMRNTPIPIIIHSRETENLLANALSVADDMGDSSLQECLYRLKHHVRISRNHTIMLYQDSGKYDFGWTEMVDDKCCMFGGIIYHENKDSNHWQIHT